MRTPAGPAPPRGQARLRRLKWLLLVALLAALLLALLLPPAAAS